MLRRRFAHRPRQVPGWLVIVLLLAAVSAVSGIPYLVVQQGTEPFGGPGVMLGLPPGTTIQSLQKAEVVEVIDGDTIDVRIGRTLVRVRYFGVDTPERGDECFVQARERNRVLVGGSVRLLPDARDIDSFGRSLRYIFLESGVSVEATLVADGYGLAWREGGRYRDQIVMLEEEAKAARRGCLWE